MQNGSGQAPNSAIELYRAWSKKFSDDKRPLEPTAREKTMLALLDHFNTLHFQDRKLIREELRQASRKLSQVYTADHGE